MNWIKIEHHNDFPRYDSFVIAIRWRQKDNHDKTFYTYHIAHYDKHKRQYVYQADVQSTPDPYFEILEEYYCVIVKPTFNKDIPKPENQE